MSRLPSLTLIAALGACSGASPTIAPPDAGAAQDTPAIVDLSPTDTGSTTDTGSVTDTGTTTDTGSAVDAPPPADAPPADAPPADAPPACVQMLIRAMMSAPVGNPRRSIHQCTYRDAPVFFLPAQCCDQFSALVSATCESICAPDGGFTGRGDGRCTDFDRSTCTLLWQDPRER